MMLDQQLLMSDAQVVTATANSTNLIDRFAAGSLGSGEDLTLLLQTKDGSTAAPTFTAALVGADDSGFSTNKITIATLTPTLTTGAYAIQRYGIPHHLPKRYYRIEYTISGGTSPSVTVNAGLAINEQTTPMV